MKMKWQDHQFNPALGRARGLGAAGAGATHHWIHQRVTAAANVFLTIWFVTWALSLLNAVASAANMDTLTPDAHVQGIIAASLSTGLNPVLMILFVASVFYHAKLGLQVVIEDYLHHEGIKIASLLALKLVLIFMAALCLYSILKVTL